MNKKNWILILTIIICLGIGGFMYYKNSNQNNETNENSITNAKKEQANNSGYTSERTSTNFTNENNENTTSKSETEIATFSTKIYSTDSKRQNNIQITCSSLNNTDVASR